ncbi:hypothetical protein ABPG74_002605 [Tetrahymena malaccensis]
MNDLCRIAMVHANKEALSEDIVNRFQILFEIIDKLKQYGTTWQIIQQVLFDKNYTYEQSKQPYSRSSSQQLDFPQERKDNNPITRVILKQGHLHLIDFVRIHINLLALLYQYGEGKLSQEDLQNSLIEQIRQTNEENLEQSQNYLLIKPIRNIIEEDKQQSEVESEQSESEVKKLKVNQYSEQSLKNISHKFKKYLLELEFNPKNKQNSKKQEFKANTYQCELQKQKQKQKLQQLIIIKGKLSKSQQDQFTNSKLVEEKMQLQYQYQQHIQSRHLDKLITREPRQKKLEFKMGTFGFNRQLLELQNSTNTLIKKEQQQKDSDIRTLQKNKCEQISLSQLQKRKMLNLAKKNQIAEIKRYSIKLVKNKLISLNLKSNDDLSYKANSCKKQFKEINVQTANKGDLLKNKVFDLTVQSGNQLIKHQKLQKNPEYNCNQQKVYHIQYDLNYNNEEILKRRLEKNTQQRTLCQHISQINQELSNLNTFYLVEQQQQSLLKMQQCNKLLGGGCACSSQIKVETVNPVQRNGQYQIKQIIDGKEKLKKEFVIQNPDDKLGGDDDDFKDFNEQYDKYINTQKVSEKVIETQVRRMVEITLYDYREQIVQTEIRHKVIDLINLLINYFLIIKQNNSKQSIQSDINLVGEYLQKLIIYCKENKERHPCLDLYQYFDILKTLNSQRIGLDVANQSVVIKIIQKVVQVVKFGAGFVSIAGAIKNLTEINLSQINNFVNEIKQIVQQVTSQSSTDAIKIGLGSYSDYNTNNIANNLQALWLKKLSNILQVKEYSDDIFNKIKNIASMIAQSSQFRYIKAQLLLYFAQILQLSSKNEYNEIMITNSSLHSIHFVSSKNIFLVRATKSLFEIDAQTFETLNTFTFSFAISTLQINNLQYFVNLINNEIFHGDMQNGFSLLNTIQAQKCLSFDNYIITLQNKETIIQNLKNLEILKVMKDVDLNLTRSQFTPDGKYLLMISNSETLQIWSVEKEFELVKTIEGHTVFKMTFSEDGKYLATSSFSEPITCKIWSIENEFQLMQTIETGHKDLIHTLSFSADGKYVSTASFLDNFCQIWNIESGNNKLVNQIQGHTEYISTLTFSPDNKFLATCSKDETCRIWNTEKGFELIQTIETGHTQLISQASFSADSKYLATSSLEGNAKIWSVNQGFKLINTIQGHTDSISSIAFSTDGKYLATGSKDKTCKIWNILKGFELQTTIQGHTDSIKSVNFSVDNKYLFTGSKDHTCKIWNVNQGFELIQTIQGHTNSITCVASSRDGNYLATTSKDYSCKIWNIQKGFTLVNTIIEANAYMQQVAFSEDGKYLAIGQGDNTCQIWSVLKGFEKVNIIDGLDFAFITIAFSQNGKYLATGCRNSNFKVWNFEKGFDFINKIDTQHTSTINSVSFSSDGRYLVTGSQDNTYKIWSTEKGFDYLGQIEGHKNTILSVVFSEDSKYLATCSGDKTCKIWNVQKGFELIKTIEAHKDWVCSVAFSSNSKYLATGSWDKTCKIWNLERDFELVNNIEGHTNKIQSVAFSANNKYLATSSEDKTFKIWNPAKGFSLVVTIQQEKAEHLAFSVDSKYLVQGTNVWSVEKGFQFLKSIDGHTRISSIALSKNGKYLATTGSLYKTCKIWNIEKGFDLIYTFEEQSSFILSCGFSEDCKYLAIGLQDCTCKIWNIEKGLQDSYQIDQKIINENENKLNHQYIISKNIFYQAFQV